MDDNTIFRGFYNAAKEGTTLIVFDIERKIADIGNTKQLNIVSWNKGKAKLDLRSWRTDDNGSLQPNKGITLTDAEAKNLYKALGEYLQTI